MRFGREMIQHWALDSRDVYLNHGTFGVTPKRVMAAQQALRDTIERHPARFLGRELMSLEAQPPSQPTRLRRAADKVGAFLGARGDDLVFVDNASSGVNAVLRSLRLQAGDEIVLFDSAYGAVARTAAFVAREHGARVVTLPLAFPVADSSTCVAALAAALTPRTRVAVLDHISSETALVMPLAQMAALCRDRRVPVLADGAHAPGAIHVDIPALGVDWYVANLHKWAFAPRACGVLWAAPGQREGLHPNIISWGLDVGWHQEFEWTGTRDPTPFLCAPDGIAFITDFLGTDAMREHNHALAWRAAQFLGERWGLPWVTPESMVGCMVAVPLPAALGSDRGAAERLKDWLFFERRIELAIFARGGQLWARVATQVYNDFGDIERFAEVIDERSAS